MVLFETHFPLMERAEPFAVPAAKIVIAQINGIVFQLHQQFFARCRIGRLHFVKYQGVLRKKDIVHEVFAID